METRLEPLQFAGENAFADRFGQGSIGRLAAAQGNLLQLELLNECLQSQIFHVRVVECFLGGVHFQSDIVQLSQSSSSGNLSALFFYHQGKN